MLHGFGVFLVTLLALLLVYFGIGSAVRYKKGIRSFPEVLPNYRFWKWLGAVIRDGVLYVFMCGKYRPSPSAEVAVLPTRPRDFAFDRLDMDDGDENEAEGIMGELDDDEAIEPAVIVNY